MGGLLFNGETASVSRNENILQTGGVTAVRYCERRNATEGSGINGYNDQYYNTHILPQFFFFLKAIGLTLETRPVLWPVGWGGFLEVFSLAAAISK